jgi:2,3-bisphosphoglycerate-dependent phosphoglycerate mutase
MTPAGRAIFARRQVLACATMGGPLTENEKCRRLILARHGESEANAANIFTGWADPPLTEKGEAEARQIASRLSGAAIPINVIYTSALRRAFDSADLVRQSIGHPTLEIERSEALNERDYGALTGLNKAETISRYGTEQVAKWRRSWAEGPPDGESLKETAGRVLPFYVQSILPSVMRGRSTLVMAHGNSLRALCMTLEHLTPASVETLEIATGSCRIYLLAADTTVIQATLLDSDHAETLFIAGAS